jgi:hypothetical protein
MRVRNYPSGGPVRPDRYPSLLLVAMLVTACGDVPLAPRPNADMGARRTLESAAAVVPVINEFVANHVGTDTHEYIEVFGAPLTDYSAYTVLQIEGDEVAAGIIDSAHPVGTTDADGYWWTGFLTNVLENGTITILLVHEFTGVVGQDLDTDNDGVLDVMPWSGIVDAVAVSDGGATDRTYGIPVLAPGFGGSAFAPGGASRMPNGVDTDADTDWLLNDFDGDGLPGFLGTPDAGEAANTPGTVNRPAILPPPPVSDALEFLIEPATINCTNQNALLTVVVHGTSTFHATSIDHATVRLEGAMERHLKGGLPVRHEQDVDADGITDLVFHFRLGDTSLDCTSTTALLSGRTFDGTQFNGSAAVGMMGS